MKRERIIELVIDESTEDLGVEIMSLVDNPAIGVEWIAFSEIEVGDLVDDSNTIYINLKQDKFDSKEAELEGIIALEIINSSEGTIKYFCRESNRLFSEDTVEKHSLQGLVPIMFYKRDETCVIVDDNEVCKTELSYSDYPKGISDTAQRVLNFVEKNGWGSCGTSVGKTRASQLAKREPVSLDTVKRMYSYLSRHKGDLTSSKTYEEGCGKLMYDAWGGEAALSWSSRIVESTKQMKFQSIDEDKRIVTGAFLIPNLSIARQDEMGIYYVYYKENTVRKVAERFLSKYKHNNTDVNHSDEITTKNTLIESWIVEDSNMDKSALYGFDLPVGTWMGSYRINDDTTWELIKEGKLNGFSITGFFMEG